MSIPISPALFAITKAESTLFLPRKNLHKYQLDTINIRRIDVTANQKCKTDVSVFKKLFFLVNDQFLSHIPIYIVYIVHIHLFAVHDWHFVWKLLYFSSCCLSPAVVIWVQGALVTLASTKTAPVELQVTLIGGC